MLKAMRTAASVLFGGRSRRAWRNGVSKYMPHTGAKEQERAKRCRMERHHGLGAVRSAPTIRQMSKRQYAALQAMKHAA